MICIDLDPLNLNKKAIISFKLSHAEKARLLKASAKRGKLVHPLRSSRSVRLPEFRVGDLKVKHLYVEILCMATRG